jgi:prepilin-type N-terminal cleavage/methylation domain-containing protein
MKPNSHRLRSGFTLLETVIAIGVLAVLLTGFMVVFTPAADGIRKSINVQQADRFASTLEEELVTPRIGSGGQMDFRTGFDKSFDWIMGSQNVANALVVYQYRGRPNNLRPDGTPTPEPNAIGRLPGRDYIVVSTVRRRNDPRFAEDLAALEGAVYVVKCTQLVFGANGLILSPQPGSIRDPKPNGGAAARPDDYPEAVIAFTADFHMMPSKDPGFYTGSAFNTRFQNARNPVFSRNLAVRR